jgi:hypothetical protein
MGYVYEYIKVRKFLERSKEFGVIETEFHDKNNSR